MYHRELYVNALLCWIPQLECEPNKDELHVIFVFPASAMLPQRERSISCMKSTCFVVELSRLSNFPQVTELGSGRDGIRTKCCMISESVPFALYQDFTK